MHWRERILAIIACLLWSTAIVGVKWGLEYLPPLTLAGSRFILAGLMLIPFCGGFRAVRRLWMGHRLTLLYASLLNTVLLYALFFTAVQFVRGAQAAIMIGISPLVSATVAHFSMKNDRMTGRKTFSIMLGMGGVVLLALASKPWDPVGARECGGLLLLLCSSIVGAFGNVVVARSRSESLNPVALASLQMILGGAVLLAAGVTLEDINGQPFALRFYLVLGWLSFISAAAFAIWFQLLQRVAVSELNLWKFLIPLSGAILGWGLIREEHPDVLSLIGMLLVVIGIISSQRVSRVR